MSQKHLADINDRSIPALEVSIINSFHPRLDPNSEVISLLLRMKGKSKDIFSVKVKADIAAR